MRQGQDASDNLVNRTIRADSSRLTARQVPSSLPA
jgi:hypothetical protein